MRQESETRREREERIRQEFSHSFEAVKLHMRDTENIIPQITAIQCRTPEININSSELEVTGDMLCVTPDADDVDNIPTADLGWLPRSFYRDVNNIQIHLSSNDPSRQPRVIGEISIQTRDGNITTQEIVDEELYGESMVKQAENIWREIRGE